MMSTVCKEGTLNKYTNVVKGWQKRYFILNPVTGILEYHISQNELSTYPNKPRGSLPLDGAVISPSQEDSCTFYVNASNGEVYKLRASNAKERQDWVDRLRGSSEFFSSQTAEDNPPLPTSNVVKNRTRSIVSNFNKFKDQVTKELGMPQSTSYTLLNKNQDNKAMVKPDNLSELKESYETLMDSNDLLTVLTKILNSIPFQLTTQNTNNMSASYQQQLGSQVQIPCTDKDILLIKSTASSAQKALTDAYQELSKFSLHTHSSSAQIEWLKNSESSNEIKNQDIDLEAENKVEENKKVENIQLANPDDEIESVCNYNVQEDPNLIDENKNIFLHLISQLKLGMDLTKVTMPAFILEKRSLLEMYADFYSPTQLLIDVCTAKTPLQRMNSLVIYYLASFYCARKGNDAQKPYNPVLGETFQCSFYKDNNKKNSRFQFVAEQISHQPPTTAMHVTCDDLQLQLTTALTSKCRFMNMSVGLTNVGRGKLKLSKYDEVYTINYPSVYCKQLLTTPYCEITGKCTIECEKTKLSATINFLTKPNIGGELNRITAEVKKNGEVVTKVTGKWNEEIDLEYLKTDEEESVSGKSININQIEIGNKFVTPLEKQQDRESRKFWRELTSSLEECKFERASELKLNIEEKERSSKDLTYQPQYFVKVPVDDCKDPCYEFVKPVTIK